jgi:High potential iron-sulfur protein
MSLSRRTFIENSAIMMIASSGISRVAWSAPAPALSESDPTAVSLGYKANASNVDKAKFPQYAAGQSCSSCALYQGTAGASSGPCAVFSGKSVSSTGWCASYSKKA